MATTTHNPETQADQNTSTIKSMIRAGCFYGSIVGPIPMLLLLMVGGGQQAMLAFIGLLVVQAVMLRAGHNYGQ